MLEVGFLFVLVFNGVYSYPELSRQIQHNDLLPDSSRQFGASTDTLVLGSCIVVLNRLCPDKDITFHLFTRNNPITPEGVRIGADNFQSNLTATFFNPNLPTKVIVHGYNSRMNLPVLVEIRKEYLKLAPMNVFTVDWSPLAQGPCYPAAVWNAKFAGKCGAQLLERILELGAEDVHVIGFSLGAHVTNFIANNLRPYKLPRITGLDPAMPGYITVDSENKLDKNDARFVDIIHTNAFMQGKVEESGDVDFFVNGGIIQPGCWAENRDFFPGFFACNHHRAPLYFAESINTERGFFGWPCPSYFDSFFGQCPPKEPQVVMGEHVNRTASGVYLVITDSVPPYAVGKYTGPLIEILLRKRKQEADFQKYKKDMECFVDDDFEKPIQQNTNSALDFSLSYSDFFN